MTRIRTKTIKGMKDTRRVVLQKRVKIFIDAEKRKLSAWKNAICMNGALKTI